ncbi:MAG: hypothetical protein MHM6MM_000937 [Cercozoa sp. M6MM]
MADLTLREQMENLEDPRLGAWLDALRECDVAVRQFPQSARIVGFECDEGTVRNGGRAGGAGAYKVFEEHLRKVGPVFNALSNADLTQVHLSLGGTATGPLEQAHESLQSLVRQALDKANVAIVVGGDNSQSYENYRALADTYRRAKIGVVNIDAHLDVRPLNDGAKHSGSPFRCMLEDAEFEDSESIFVEFAAQAQQCSRKHVQYVKDKKQHVYFLSELLCCSSIERVDSDMTPWPSSTPMAARFEKLVLERFDNARCDAVFVSFDIDSIRSADCPGVSCPAPVGLSADDAMRICFLAGRHPRVQLLDVSEFNPAVEDYRTGRLVACMVYAFLCGLAMRQR